jgi:hypothetical protein
LEVSLAGDESEVTQTVSTPELEPLRLGNPAARALPLLEALARGRDTSVCLPLSSHQSLRVDLKSGRA